LILSIESSCDDSSIAITNIETKEVVFHKKISQELEHSKYGGVVPELASRLHATALPNILSECKEFFDKLRAVAVTTEPGLSVTLQEGIMMAKTIAMSLNIPLIPINHLKGHVFSLFIEKEINFPQTVLLVSGGHTQIIEVNQNQELMLVANSLDDSFGESFDKVSKMLGFGYPGGPIIEKMALSGDENRFDFPVPLRQSPKIAFSYSGIKNAVRVQIEKLENISQKDKEDICASFQKTAVEHLLQKSKKYLKTSNPKAFAIVGGASANIYLRDKFKKLADEFNIDLNLAKLEYCSDNAVMIGRVAIEEFKRLN
jgi:N6-L-threonylcarbamoyladenine synthase